MNEEKTKKRRCEPHGQIEKRRTKDEQKTNKRRTKDEQKTNNERRKGGEMMKDKACKIVEKVEFVEGDYG